METRPCTFTLECKPQTVPATDDSTIIFDSPPPNSSQITFLNPLRPSPSPELDPIQLSPSDPLQQLPHHPPPPPWSFKPPSPLPPSHFSPPHQVPHGQRSHSPRQRALPRVLHQPDRADRRKSNGAAWRDGDAGCGGGSQDCLEPGGLSRLFVWGGGGGRRVNWRGRLAALVTLVFTTGSLLSRLGTLVLDS